MLSRLSVRGFKSFADQTSLELGPGVNVVVGPNGSGKSNLAEAVAWALGEQRAGRLRAGGMADVLYSGGARRAAAPAAEVKLVLAGDEIDGSAPAEVEAARRLTRAGDADYRLNGAACRLLDVQEALAARGVGPDALAVIRQGQVEALCTSTPAERRAIVDAAAGVAVAKRRRHRAELKLGRVADRLERARDIAGELRARARALDRQARAAERVTALEGEVEAARRAVGAAARGGRRGGARAAAPTPRGSARPRRPMPGRSPRRARRARGSRAIARARPRPSRRRNRWPPACAARRSAWPAGPSSPRSAWRWPIARRRAGRAAPGGIGAPGGDRRRRRGRRGGRGRRRGGLRRGRRRRRGGRGARSGGARGAPPRGGRGRGRLGAVSAAAREQDDAERRAEEARAAAAQLELLPEAPDPALLDRAERREEVAAARAARWAERAARAEGAAADADAERAGRPAAVARGPGGRAGAGAGGREGDRAAAGLGDGLEVEPGMERAVAAALGALADAVPAPTLEEGRRPSRRGVLGCRPRARTAPPAAPPGARPLLELVAPAPPPPAPSQRLLADASLVERLDDVPAGAQGIAVTVGGKPCAPRTGL